MAERGCRLHHHGRREAGLQAAEDGRGAAAVCRAFWQRRDPTPDTEENEYKEEHYRRIAYANDHYASGIPGWKTDRGMIYIKYGPPDEIDSHPSGGSYERPMEEGGGETSTYPFEDWRYRYIDGIGTNIIIEFVDTTMSGEYHISLDPEEKDALLYVPGAGLTHGRADGHGGQDAALPADGRHAPGHGQSAASREHERVHPSRAVRQIAEAPPPSSSKIWTRSVNSNIRYNTLPMQVRADYIRVTDSTVLRQHLACNSRTAICSTRRKTRLPRRPSTSMAASRR